MLTTIAFWTVALAALDYLSVEIGEEIDGRPNVTALDYDQHPGA